MRLSPSPPVAQGPIEIPQDVPVYKVMDEKGFHADDELFPQDAIIPWEGGLNPQLWPMNELAHVAMQEYLEYLDNCGREKAKQDKVAYMPLMDAYKRRKADEERELEAPHRTRDLRTKDLRAKKQIPLMQAKKDGPRTKDISKGEK